MEPATGLDSCVISNGSEIAQNCPKSTPSHKREAYTVSTHTERLNKVKTAQLVVVRLNRKHAGGRFREFGAISAPTKSCHVQNHGLKQRLFAQNRPISDTCKFTRNPHEQSRKQLQIHLQACGDGFGSLERLPAFTKIRHVPNHGLSPRLLAQNRPISGYCEFTRNTHKQSHKQLETICKHVGLLEQLGTSGALKPLEPLWYH